MPEEEFPEVQGGGSLLLAWQIRNKKVLIIGGGEVRPCIRLPPPYQT
jgi:precorrin-2 dehydrogenase/sirohydrochlorin ferrochelatase